jgi:hypothetical protein
MMEVSASALTGAMRVGLQIASTYRGPHLEIYYEVINQYGPEQEFKLPAFSRDAPPEIHKTRFQDLSIQFQMINIGGQRAENIRLTRSGTFERHPGRDFGGLFEISIPQMAPGQVLQLFLLNVHELETVKDKKVAGFKDDELIISVDYDSPMGIVNSIKTAPARLRGKAHHQTLFRFLPKLVFGDLPPARYV